MLVLFIPSGILLKSLLKIDSNNFSITAFLGMFFQCVLLSICCFFTNISIEIFIANAVFCSSISWYKFSEVKNIIQNLKSDLKLFSVYSKIILLIILISSLYKCSLAPFLIDNESYYIQTIKWINEYGFVKGLANLHVFFAQNSPLHVLQAGFNFNFLNSNFNDINGLILLLSALFFITKFELQFKKSNSFHWIGFILIFDVLFFQFIGQPSPDLIIVLVSQIIFYLFVEENESENALKTAICLFLMLFFIKIIILPLALLFLFWMYKQKKGIVLFATLGLFLSIILIIKNTIISGYPLFPFRYFATDFKWKLPTEFFKFITVSTKNAGYFENELIENPSFYQKIIAWLQLSGLNSIFNYGIILLFILSVFTNEFRKNLKYKTLYFVLLVHFIALLITSPQFRFFLPEFVFFAVLIIANTINYLKMNFRFVQVSLILFLLFSLIFIEFLDFKKVTDNTLMQSRMQFQQSNLLVPAANSKYDKMKFETIKNENLTYYSPCDNFFFYGTADGKLPCVNKVQIDYFEKYYFIKPQMLTHNLKDGFYSKTINHNNE